MYKISKNLAVFSSGVVAGMLVLGGLALGDKIIAEYNKNMKRKYPKMQQVAKTRQALNDVAVDVQMYCATSECDSNTIKKLNNFKHTVDSIDNMIEDLAIDGDVAYGIQDSIKSMKRDNMTNHQLINAASENTYRLKNDFLQIELENARDSIRMLMQKSHRR